MYILTVSICTITRKPQFYSVITQVGTLTQCRNFVVIFLATALPLIPVVVCCMISQITASRLYQEERIVSHLRNVFITPE